MDCNPGVSLSFLYRNDPFYSLCLSDLMRAPQGVSNQFLKEQRNLTESLKRIDHCQMSRIGQLNEEKRQFALLMKRRLTPRSSRLFSLAGERDSIRTCSAKNFRDLTSGKSSTESCETVSTVSSYRTGSTASKSSNNFEGKKWRNHTSHLNVRREYSTTMLQEKKCQYGETAQLLVRSESCFPSLRSENNNEAPFLTSRRNL
ncbi:uncharacterized protein LOC108716549 [Xenopus laevis]|uniref:Uncharacterized protein n=2 Tax=Xenopus laevis TaxID=8355 RepID=A0A974I5Q8_XENLA|nr:uncharacterized protein LOC108716549 [Xenopus laevis]OCU02017.1 hypothetical protein XELAEV_18007774mg [Xenopus laevis]